MYALMMPTGRMVEETASRTRRECWGKSFDVVARAEGDDWQKKYWKRWEASMRDAKKRHYRIVKVKLVLDA